VTLLPVVRYCIALVCEAEKQLQGPGLALVWLEAVFCELNQQFVLAEIAEF